MSDYIRPPDNDEELSRFYQELCRVVNKLTQGTYDTTIAEPTFVENAGGTAVNDDSTFDGYTPGQVVKALRNLGVLT